MENIIKYFSDIRAFTRYLETNETKDGFPHPSSQKRDNRDFTMTDSYEEASELLSYGDKKLAQKIEDAGVKIARAKIKNTAPRRVLYTSVVGCAPNVPAYLCGAPNSMIAIKKEQQKTRTLSILFNARVACNIRTNQIIEASAKILSAILNIESQGIRVELLYTAAVYDHNQNIMPIIKIKNQQQPLDVTKIAYVFAHPSMFRRHIFRFIEVTEGVDSRFYYGYGYGCKEKNVRQMMKDAHIEKSVLLTLEDVLNMDSDEVKNYIISQAENK